MGFFGDNFDDPRTQGILQAAATMLGSRGQNFGQSLGAGLQAGISGYGDAQKIQSAMLMKKAEDAMKQKLMESQIAESESQNQARQIASDKLKQQMAVIDQYNQGGGVRSMEAIEGGPMESSLGGSVLGRSDGSIAGNMGGMQQPAGKITLQQVLAYKNAGLPDLLDIYKQQESGTKIDADSYRMDDGGKIKYFPKAREGSSFDAQGNSIEIPNASGINARYKGAETQATEAAKATYDLVDIVNPVTNQTMKVPRALVASAGQGGVNLGGQGGYGVSAINPANVTYNNETAKSAAESYKSVQTAGMQAPGKIAKYQQMGKLLQDFEGGKLSGAGLQLSSIGNSLGIKIDKNLSNKEALNALSIELANASREAGSGVFTDKDFEHALDAAPNLSQSAAGRKTIIENNIKKLQRDQEIAKMAAKWSSKYGRIDAAGKNGKTFQENLNEWYKSQPAYGK